MTMQKKSPPVSRRKFIQTAGAGALALGAAPAILRAAEPVVVGSGEHKYEWDSTWATLPEGKHYGNAHAIQVVADGRFFVHNTGVDAICVFDPAGKFIESWGKEYAGGAHGMQLRKEGNDEYFYLALTGQHRVVKIDTKGKVVWELKGAPVEHEEYAKNKLSYVPTNIAVMPGEGDIYVSDGYGSSFVHQYTKDGKFIRAFGGKQKDVKALGSLNSPHGIFIDSRSGKPIVIVADRGNGRIQNFTPEGVALNASPDELRMPCHFDVRGSDLLIPDLQGRVTIFDKDNKLVTHLGDNPDAKRRGPNGHKMPPDQWKDGLFHNPHGACYDKDGNIYVAEWLEPIGRVTKLKKIA